MARNLKLSRVVPGALDSDEYYNRAVNRGEDTDTYLDTTAVRRQPAKRFLGRRFRRATKG